MTDDRIGFVAAAFSGRKRARSKVYLWLLEHYAELSAAKETGRGRVDWIGVTSELSGLGLRADGNKALKPETVRRIWNRVVADQKSGAVLPPIPRPPEQARSRLPHITHSTEMRPGPPPDDEISDDEFFRPITKLP